MADHTNEREQNDSIVASDVTDAPLSSPRPGLGKLIEAHRVANAHYENALIVQEKVEEAFYIESHNSTVLVPLSITPSGKCYSGYHELGPISPAEIRKSILDIHRRLRDVYCSAFARDALPELALAAERELELSQERALQALAEAEQDAAARERDPRRMAAREVTDRAQREEFDARLALAVYVPRSNQEAYVKRKYIETSEPFGDGTCIEGSEFVDAIIAKINDMRA